MSKSPLVRGEGSCPVSTPSCVCMEESTFGRGASRRRPRSSNKACCAGEPLMNGIEMNQHIQQLMQDSSVAERLRAVRSVAEASALLVEAAATRGLKLARDAVESFLGARPVRPRELDANELMAVGGGRVANQTFGADCGNTTNGHTCCGHCF